MAKSNLAVLLPNDTEMSYGLANRLASVNQQNITLDADGNMVEGLLQGELTQFSFDSRNRLTQAGNTQYHYDAENQRTAVNNTQYVINSQPNLSQVLVRTKGNGEVTYYVYGLGLIGEESAGNYFSYHFDYRGSTVALTNTVGQVVDRIAYSAYGELLTQPIHDTPFLFNGMYGVMSDENNLYYMRARFYSPEIKRFVNQDVLLGNVAEGQSLNRYIFVKGKPAQYTDPFGLFSTEDGASLTLDFVPVVGSCKGVVEFIFGKDPITGEPIPRWIAAIGIIPGGKYVTKTGDFTINAYRAVSKAELDDITRNGFKSGPNSMEEKWFSESQEGAEKFLEIFEDLEKVIHVKIPKEVYDKSYKHKNIDGTGPGFCVSCEDLKGIMPE